MWNWCLRRMATCRAMSCHYELEVKANGYDWMVHTTKYVEVGSHVGIRVIPFNIQVMHKPESSDEKAVEIDV